MDPIIQRALDHLEYGRQIDLPCDAGRRWDAYANLIRARAYDFEEIQEVIAFAQSQETGIETRFSSKEAAAMAPEAEAELVSLFPSLAQHIIDFTESSLADPATTVKYNGRSISYPTFYKITRFILSCLSRTLPTTVCEIGGGYGLPARLWINNPIHRPNRYVIVDLPEVLFLADVYLSAHFPDDVGYIGERPTRRIVLCPVGMIDQLADTQFDLAINTLSMGEMPDAFVDFYMAWLDRQPCKNFYSWNFAVIPRDQVAAETMSSAVPRLSRLWRTISAYHPGGNLLCGEIFAERPETAPNPKAELCNRWHRYWPEPMTPHSYFNLLDATRFADDAAPIWALIERATQELGFVPREIEYLRGRAQALT